VSDATDLYEKMWDTVRIRTSKRSERSTTLITAIRGADGQERKGADAGIAVTQTYTSTFPDTSFAFRHKYACGEDVSIMEVTVRGTHQGELEGIPPTGRQIEGFLCNVIDVRDGKIYREREYFDNLALLSQLGVSPQAGK
jgi:predicted ester cyclase